MVTVTVSVEVTDTMCGTGLR